MKNIFILAAALAVATGVQAAPSSEEVSPQTNSPAQKHGEVHKQNRPGSMAPMNNTGSSRGENVGKDKPGKAEMQGQGKANQREAQPHKDPVQDLSTPRS